MDKWTPVGTGADFEFSPRLERALEPSREQSGRAQQSVRITWPTRWPGDGGGDHSRATATWSERRAPKRTEGEDVRAGTTIDQMAAAKIGQEYALAVARTRYRRHDRSDRRLRRRVTVAPT